MRLYYKNDQDYISVTSVLNLKEPFSEEDQARYEKWCKDNGYDPLLISVTSRILGTKVSTWIEDSLYELRFMDPLAVDKLEKKLKEGVDDFLDRWTLLRVEETVFNSKLNYAGRFDGICKDKDGNKWLMDWKTFGAWRPEPYKRDTKKLKKAGDQLTLYKEAMDWDGKLGVVVFKNDGTYDIEERKPNPKIIQWVEDNQDLILETIKDEKAKRAVS